MAMGSVRCWGANHLGQLGDGTTTTRLTPIDVPVFLDPMTVVDISAGESHSCALASDGAVRCWGSNYAGELGNGTTSTSATPIPVDVSGSFFRTECPTLVPNVNTTFLLSNGYAAGSIATFTATAGFDLEGSATLTCLAEGAWTGPPPTAGPIPLVVPGVGTVVEGDTGSTELHIPVTLTSPSASTVTADWQSLFGPGVEPPAPAEPGTDFEAASGTVTFPPGATETTIQLAVHADTIDESDEWIVTAFGNPTNAQIGGYWGLGFGIVADDDA
jgi:hypothetical protein